MSSAKTPEAAMRESVYQEGQRAFIGNGPCPYSDWRAKTWAKGFDAARAYYAETLAQDQLQAEEPDGLQPCPFCGGAATEKHRHDHNSVTCSTCGASVQQSGMGYGDAAKLWNRRA